MGDQPNLNQWPQKGVAAAERYVSGKRTILVKCSCAPFCYVTESERKTPLHKNRGRTRKQTLLAAAVALPFLFAPQSANADGPECNLTTHCYGVVHYNESQPFSAAGEDLWTDCLHLDTPLSDLANHDFWIQWDNGTWIESGYHRGVHAGGDTATNFRWFWAEYTGTTFYSHKVANAPLSTWVNFSWYRQTSVANNGKWALFIDGTYRAMTSGTYANATETDTGGESTEPLVYSNGNSQQMQVKRASDGVWYTPSIDNVTETAGVYDAWHNGSSAMEQQSLQNDCAEAPLAAKAAAKSPTDDDLLTFAGTMAKNNGGKPEAVELATTKRRNAFANNKNAEATDNPDVHVLQVKGNFTGNMVGRPKGAKAPKGNVLTYVIDKATGEVTDWSLGKEAQDLKKFGSVKKLG